MPQRCLVQPDATSSVASLMQGLRDRAAGVFGVSPQLRDGALDAHLDGLGRPARFSVLTETARNARDRHAVLSAAQALHNWLWEKNR